MTLVVYHLVEIIDRIKYDLHNRATLHDVYAVIEVLMNGIQGLKSTIGMHPGLPYDTLWSAISDISLVFDYNKLSAIDKSISDFNSRQK